MFYKCALFPCTPSIAGCSIRCTVFGLVSPHDCFIRLRVADSDGDSWMVATVRVGMDIGMLCPMVVQQVSCLAPLFGRHFGQVHDNECRIHCIQG